MTQKQVEDSPVVCFQQLKEVKQSQLPPAGGVGCLRQSARRRSGALIRMSRVLGISVYKN